MPSPSICSNKGLSDSPEALTKYVGDTWIIAFFSNDGDESKTPYDLTGFVPSGVLWIGNASHAISMQPQNPTYQLSQGWFVLAVPPSVTSIAPPDPTGAVFFGTRLQVILTDASGNSETWFVQPINVRAP